MMNTPNQTPKYRHEYKYFVSAAEVEMLKLRANAILQKDTHVHTEGKFAGMYNIRSVYFDDMADTAYFENENGVDRREKFRIRIYNRSDEKISLELKSKVAGRCLKQSCSLSREQCDMLIRGKPLPASSAYHPLLQKLLLQQQTRGLQPKVLVEYDRIPYVFPIGNVRVTLDCNLRSTTDCAGLFSSDLAVRPVFPAGQQILEVKWDELLPDFIYQSMMLQDLQWTSCSKYYLCRRYTI